MPSQGPTQVNPIKSRSKEVAQHQHHLAPFTIKELRDAIPAHCFDRSLLKSSAYLVVDLILISAFLFVGHYFNNYISQNTSWIVAFAFWSLLWFAQGAVMTGVWIIGHECGHQSFSKYKNINDIVGLIVHSALLAPYHSWRITHGIHHKSTSHMNRDQVFVPKTHSQVHSGQSESLSTVIAESPFIVIYQMIVCAVLGWPLYLATNAWGQDYGQNTSHFNPNSKMFKPSQRFEVMLSNFGMITMLGFLAWFGFTYSFDSLFKYYVVPYLWVYFWFTTITYLQHTDKRVPHFRGEEWNFIRGALCTVDRSYGWILNVTFHHIQDTHVAHHLFSQIPHYHAEEATESIKKVLGDYYLEDHTHFLKAAWNCFNTCHYVDDNDAVVYYKTVDFSKTKKKL